MVKVKFIADKEEGTLEFRAKGHANTAAPGKDLLCASVSTLALTLASYVKRAYAEGLLLEEPKIKIQNGRTVVRAKPTNESFAEILHAYYVIEVGMSFLWEYQPNHIDLTVFDESIQDFSINKDPSTLRTE